MPSGPSTLPFHVVCAGLITRADGALLIARRPPGGFMPGYWEFPGGKLEPGETPEAGLAREIREELRVEIENARIFHAMAHAYPDRRVLILFYRCAIREGEPAGPETGGLEHAWVKPSALASYEMLPADAEVIDRILEEG